MDDVSWKNETALHARNRYLDQLISWDDEPALDDVVRILSGVRRCGKSSLLSLYKQHLGADKVLSINFEDLANAPLRDAERFHQFVLGEIAEQGFTHLHVDEVQEIHDWARVINSLRVSPASKGLKITVTGSNASMFSGEGLTYLAGRYIELKVFPLSLAEFRQFTPLVNADAMPSEQAYAEWMKGTLPATVQVGDEATQRTLNNAVFDSIFTRDIAMRGSIQDPEVFLKVARFVFDNVGSPLSVNKIANGLSSQGTKTSNHTIEKYLRLLVDAHMFYHCSRYDVRGKQYLRSGGKYYFVDPGLRDALLGRRSSNTGHDLENMVYIELLRRGYQVFSAQSAAREIDFLAEKENEKHFIQVALTALDPITLGRELRAFEGLSPGARCTLITFDRLPLATGEVKHIHAGDFLDGAELTS